MSFLWFLMRCPYILNMLLRRFYSLLCFFYLTCPHWITTVLNVLATFSTTLTTFYFITKWFAFFLGLWEGNQCGTICDPIPVERISQSDPVSPKLCGERCRCYWWAAQSVWVSPWMLCVWVCGGRWVCSLHYVQKLLVWDCTAHECIDVWY